MSAPPRRLAVVVVQHGDEEPAARCLDSLAAAVDVELHIVLVDHNPERSDRLAARVAALGGAYLHQPANPGFAAGVNAGFRAARRQGRFDGLAAMNADVTVAPDALCLLAAALDRDPRIGVAGPGILQAGREERWWNVGSRIDWPAARPRSLHHGEARSAVAREVADTGFVCGCLLLVRPDALEQVGPLAEDYFLYFEDADYSLRARRAGWRTVVVPAAVARHEGGTATGNAPGLAAYCRTRSRLVFSRRWNPHPVRGRLHRLAFALRALLRPLWGPASRRAEHVEGARAALDYLRGRPGRVS